MVALIPALPPWTWAVSLSTQRPRAQTGNAVGRAGGRGRDARPAAPRLPPPGSAGRPPPRARAPRRLPPVFPPLSTLPAPRPSSSLLPFPRLPSRPAQSAYLVASLGPRGRQVSNRGVSAPLVSFSVSASISVSLLSSASRSSSGSVLSPSGRLSPAVWWPEVAAGPTRDTMSGACTSYVSAEQEVVRGFSCPRPGGEAAAVFCCGFRDHKYCCDDPHSFFPYEHSYMWWLRYRPWPSPHLEPHSVLGPSPHPRPDPVLNPQSSSRCPANVSSDPRPALTRPGSGGRPPTGSAAAASQLQSPILTQPLFKSILDSHPNSTLKNLHFIPTPNVVATTTLTQPQIA